MRRYHGPLQYRKTLAVILCLSEWESLVCPNMASLAVTSGGGTGLVVGPSAEAPLDLAGAIGGMA